MILGCTSTPTITYPKFEFFTIDNDPNIGKNIYTIYQALLEGELCVEGASGCMVYWNEAKSYGYILTAYHVIDDIYNKDVNGKVRITWRKPDSSQDNSEFGIIWMVDIDNDLALIKSNVRHKLFRVMSDDIYQTIVDSFENASANNKPLRLVMSAGYPIYNRVDALLISIGYVVISIITLDNLLKNSGS